MLSEYFEQIEAIALNTGLLFLFIFIGLSMHDVMKRNDVPKTGRFVVYFVLSLGCLGFIAKGLIQYMWETAGIG